MFVSVFSVSQLIAHLIGDYVLQSGWMANEKTKSHFPALVHALVYSLPFVLLFDPSFMALVVIVGTHFLIDRYRLARYVVFIKEFIAPVGTWKNIVWKDCSVTGLPGAVAPFMSVWLMIIVDNTMHIVINGLALTYL